MVLTKEQWLEQYRNKVSERDYTLLAKAYDVLKRNSYYNPKAPWGDYRVITPWGTGGEGIWNWDSAFHAMAVSRYDTDLAKDCIDAFLQFQLPNGMLPDVMTAKGILISDLSKPPVMPWATMIVYNRDGDKDFLRRCYDRFVRNEEFLIHNRQYEGLFYYSSEEDVEKDFYLHARYESGWDNSPRWDVPIVDLWAIDFNCFMVMFYRAMQEMAEVLGEGNEIKSKWKEKEVALIKLIEAKLFDEEKGYYADTNRYTGEKITVLSPASFMPLYVGIASDLHAKAMEDLAKDRAKFYPGMPTVNYDDPTYSLDYWRGPTWLNVAYFAAKGLKNYKFAVADEIKEYLLDIIYKNLDVGIYENYDSLNGKGLFGENFSWSAAFVIEFILNW